MRTDRVVEVIEVEPVWRAGPAPGPLSEGVAAAAAVPVEREQVGARHGAQA